MSTTHKLLARTVNVTEISTFELGADETLDQRVAKELDLAITSNKLDKMATRVGLPAIAVVEVGAGEGLGGGENNVSVGLYAPNGESLGNRTWRVDSVGDAGFAAVGMDTDVEDEIIIGIFTHESVAEQVALFWSNGHLHIPQ